MEYIKSYNYEYSLVKAETVGYDKNKFITGFYIAKLNEDKNKWINCVCDVDETNNPQFYEVNPYTICRNTCIKDKNKNYIFEFDLVKVYTMGQFENYAYIEHSELYNSFIARTQSGGFYHLDRMQFEIIGNIFNDEDYKLFEEKGKEIALNFKEDYSRCCYSKGVNL